LDIIIDIKTQVVFFDVHKNPSSKIMKTSHKTWVPYSENYSRASTNIHLMYLFWHLGL